jgi:hypothetical protein
MPKGGAEPPVTLQLAPAAARNGGDLEGTECADRQQQ